MITDMLVRIPLLSCLAHKLLHNNLEGDLMDIIAIPVYKDRVSNVFDFAGSLLLVSVENGEETGRRDVALLGQAPAQRAAQVRGLDVNVVICGAVSHPLAGMIEAAGIDLLPHVTGNVDEVLQAYLDGRLGAPQYCMPGCGRGRGKGRRWRHGIK